MHQYWAMFSARFRMLLQYRAAAAAGLGTQIFWGWVRVMIFAAFHEAARPGAATMAWAQLVTYVWLGQAMLRLLPFGVDGELSAMVREGTVVYELARPIRLYWLWYARTVANLVAPTVLRAAPMFALALLLFGMDLPVSPGAAAVWAAATVGAVLLSAAIVMLLNVSMLWTVSGQGISQLVPPLTWVLSGMVLPLPLFPDWAAAGLAWLPFRGVMDGPFRVYTGHIGPDGWLAVLAHQAAWIVLLVGAGRLALARGLRRLVVQGG